MKQIKMFKNWVYVMVFGLLVLGILCPTLSLTSKIDRPLIAGQLAIIILLYCGALILFIIWLFALFSFIIVDSNGIKITCINKVLISIRWDEIANIEDYYDFTYRTSWYKIVLFNGKSTNIIQRKKFKLAVIAFGNDRLKIIAKHLQ